MNPSEVLIYSESLEITPQAFAEVFDMVRDCPLLVEGVTPSLVFEGCDPEDLEEQMVTLEANIRGAI